MAKKFPTLKHREINTEVAKRTGQSNELVWAIIRAYRDVLREALLNGVEVVIPDLCTLTFQDYPPKPAGVYWDGYLKEYIPFPNRPGDYKLKVKPHVAFKQDLLRYTTYGETSPKEEWVEWLKKYRPNRKLHGWLAEFETDDKNEVGSDG